MKRMIITTETVLLVFISLLLHADTRPVMIHNSIQACGTQLANLLQSTCQGQGYNTYYSAEIEEKKTPTQHRRRKRGIIQECCWQSCSIEDVFKYCHPGPTNYSKNVLNGQIDLPKNSSNVNTNNSINNETKINEISYVDSAAEMSYFNSESKILQIPLKNMNSSYENSSNDNKTPRISSESAKNNANRLNDIVQILRSTRNDADSAKVVSTESKLAKSNCTNYSSSSKITVGETKQEININGDKNSNSSQMDSKTNWNVKKKKSLYFSNRPVILDKNINLQQLEQKNE